MNKYLVYIKDAKTNDLCEAVLSDEINLKNINDYEKKWLPLIQDKVLNKTKKDAEIKFFHWDWRSKLVKNKTLLSWKSFAIDVDGDTQGLMIVDTLRSSRLEGQAGKPLVYIEYLESAPWNLKIITDDIKYKSVGKVLIMAAVNLSFEEGFKGRIGLHSLNTANDFYVELGMIDFGADAKNGLHYFEMDAEVARQLVIS